MLGAMTAPGGLPRFRWTLLSVAFASAAIAAGSGCAGGGPGAPVDGGGDADEDGDADRPLDGGPDADEPGDGDADADADEDGATPCEAPPGAACNPIVVGSLPFSFAGDSREAPEDLIDSYACAPSIDESGPELHFEVLVPAAGLLVAEVDEAEGVDVDLHLLADPSPESCLARANTRLEARLAAGPARLVVDSYHDGRDLAGAFVLDLAFEEARAELLGTMWNTYYFLASEDDHEGPRDTPIYDAGCAEIARVRQAFHDSVCIEGSGLLADGRVINYASTCTSSCPAARTCGGRSYRICYAVLDPAAYPWGMGAGSVALEPDRSIAVDPGFVPLGTVVYLEELDGVVAPGATEPHDGCLRADDVGGAIEGSHFDFFAGTRARWLEWEAIFPTRTEFTAWADHPRCYGR